jgi:O-antigen ligase
MGIFLFAAIALLPIQIPTTIDFNIAPTDAFIALALLAGATRLTRGLRALSPWHIAFVLVFVTSIVSDAIRDGELRRYVWMNKFAGLVVLSSFYVALASWADRWERIERLCRFFAVAVALENVVMVAMFMVPPLDDIFVGLTGVSARYGGVRLCGMLIDPNAYGGILVVAFALLFIGRDPKARLSVARRAFDGFLALALMIGIAFTFSRSAWMALGGLFAVGLLRQPKTAVKVSILAVLAVIVCVAAGVLSVEKMTDLATRQDTVEHRVEINENALSMFYANPFLGGGIGAFPQKYEVIIHNTTLWILAELGALGFAALLGMVVWFFWKGIATLRRAPVERRTLVAGLLAAHAALLMLSMGIEALYQRHWWLVLAMIGAATQAARVRASELDARRRLEMEARLR